MKLMGPSMAATSCYIRSYPLIDSITLTIPYLSKYSLESEAIFKYIHQCEIENEKWVHQMKFSVRTLVVPFCFLLDYQSDQGESDIWWKDR